MRINLSRQPYQLEKLLAVADTMKGTIREINETLSYKNHQKGEAFLLAPFEESQIVSILELKRKIPAENLKKIYVLGIGGSSQGTKAIFELLKNKKELVEIEVLDYIDSEKIYKTIKEIKRMNSEEYLFFIISKSGTTTETLYNYEIISENTHLDPKRLIFITDENSHLIKFSETIKAHHLTIPKKVSGRFSVFTNCGLAPLAFSGVNIIKLLEGAMEQINEIYQEDNSALLCAASIYLNKKILKEHLFPTRHFGELGKWEKQLFNESLGKTNNIPFTSFGNFYLELHSSLQYYLNSKNIFINTVYIRDTGTFILKEPRILAKNFESSDSEELRRGIYRSVVKEMEKNSIPVITCELEDLNEKEIGKYLQFRMNEVYFLAKLFDVNPFDQPEVQNYKHELIKYI